MVEEKKGRGAGVAVFENSRGTAEAGLEGERVEGRTTRWMGMTRRMGMMRWMGLRRRTAAAEEEEEAEEDEDGGGGGGGWKRHGLTRVRERRRGATQQRRSDDDVDEDENEDEAAAEDRRADGYAERLYGWHGGVGRSTATVLEKSAAGTNRVRRDAERRSCVDESRSRSSAAPSSAAKKREQAAGCPITDRSNPLLLLLLLRGPENSRLGWPVDSYDVPY